jgi:hypothetical protein
VARKARRASGSIELSDERNAMREHPDGSRLERLPVKGQRITVGGIMASPRD